MMVEVTQCSCFISGNNSEVKSNFLSCAPCPPSLLDFQEFVTFAGNQNLTECEIDQIANKCRLEAPIILDNLTDVITGNVTGNVTDDIVLPVFDSGHPLQSWAIILIVVFGVISLVTLTIVGVLIKNRANGSKDEKSAMKTRDNIYVMQYSSTAQAGAINVGYSSQESIPAEKGQVNLTERDKSKLIPKCQREHVGNSVASANDKEHILSGPKLEIENDSQSNIVKHTESIKSSSRKLTVL